MGASLAAFPDQRGHGGVTRYGIPRLGVLAQGTQRVKAARSPLYGRTQRARECPTNANARQPSDAGSRALRGRKRIARQPERIGTCFTAYLICICSSVLWLTEASGATRSFRTNKWTTTCKYCSSVRLPGARRGILVCT